MASTFGELARAIGDWLLTQSGIWVLVLGAVLPTAWEIWRWAQAW